MNKKSISFDVIFDENSIPEKIHWKAGDDLPEDIELKSLFVGGWDETNKSTATFNIWTKEMRVDEMQQLFIQSLLSLSSGFERATGDKQIVAQMKSFCESLSDKKDSK